MGRRVDGQANGNEVVPFVHQLIGILHVPNLGETTVCNIAFHGCTTEMLHSNVGVHVVQFVKLAHFEEQDRVEVLPLDFPPLLLPWTDFLLKSEMCEGRLKQRFAAVPQTPRKGQH